MIVIGAKEQVLAWVISHVPDIEWTLQPYEAIGFADNGQLYGGVVYGNYRGHDIEMMAAGEKGWVRPLNIRATFHYPFIELGCRRITAVASRRNKKARKFIERVGFKFEGIMRQARADGQDAFVFGMLRDECRWIT